MRALVLKMCMFLVSYMVSFGTVEVIRPRRNIFPGFFLYMHPGETFHVCKGLPVAG